MRTTCSYLTTANSKAWTRHYIGAHFCWYPLYRSLLHTIIKIFIMSSPRGSILPVKEHCVRSDDDPIDMTTEVRVRTAIYVTRKTATTLMMRAGIWVRTLYPTDMREMTASCHFCFSVSDDLTPFQQLFRHYRWHHPHDWWPDSSHQPSQQRFWGRKLLWRILLKC